MTFAYPPTAGKPKLLLPASGAVIGTYKPAFDWTDSVPAAVYYQIQVGTSSRFTTASLVIDQTDIAASNYTAGIDLLPGMRYYWRVRGFNGAEAAGSWTSARSLHTPLEIANLVTVGAGEVLKTDRPDFNWDNVSGATRYSLQDLENQHLWTAAGEQESNRLGTDPDQRPAGEQPAVLAGAGGIDVCERAVV